MRDSEHALMLLAMARRDLKAALAMTDTVVFPDEIVGFHFQQAIEKALKAWLAYLGADYPKTHDISLLLRRLSDLDMDVERFSPLIEFTSYAVQFRYEIFDETAEPLNREEASNIIRSLVEVVEHCIAQ
jgi:HEPN domain-containing protein